MKRFSETRGERNYVLYVHDYMIEEKCNIFSARDMGFSTSILIREKTRRRARLGVQQVDPLSSHRHDSPVD